MPRPNDDGADPARDALAGIRVLDCGDGIAASYAAKQLADLGADVVKIECPDRGDWTRRRGPFVGGTPDPHRSGLFLYLNTNKRGLALDLEQTAGRAALRRLAAQADLVIHDRPPARLAELGLDADELRHDHSALVVTSISPFGLTGPRRDHVAEDLTLWNAGGIAALNGGGPGHEDLPPLKAAGQQAAFQAGLNAAVASLGALLSAMGTGQGQLVEVSVQECLCAILEMTYEYYPYMGLTASRLGYKPIQPLDFLECKDGWIYICCVEEHQWQRFVELAGNPEWASLDIFADRIQRAQNWDALQIFLNEYASERTVAELYHDAQARRIPFAPVSTMGDLLDSTHLKARGFFVTVPDGGGGDVRLPGAPYRHGLTPWRIRRRAPLLGEHSVEILAQAGFSADDIAHLRSSEACR